MSRQIDKHLSVKLETPKSLHFLAVINYNISQPHKIFFIQIFYKPFINWNSYYMDITKLVKTYPNYLDDCNFGMTVIALFLRVRQVKKQVFWWTRFTHADPTHDTENLLLQHAKFGGTELTGRYLAFLLWKTVMKVK